MKDGWCDSEYFVLAESHDEALRMSSAYGISDALPGYYFVGLRGWDDFIVCSTEGSYFLVPAVPLRIDQLQPYNFPSEKLRLVADPKITGRVKWYVTPLVFGGDPNPGPNMVWISFADHQEAVRHWNRLYNDLREKESNQRQA